MHFFEFQAEIQMILEENRQMTLGIKDFIQFTPSCTIYMNNAFLSFIQKFKMFAKVLGKRFLEKIAR